ncbi:polysaccharide export outer membrane protein [Chitinophaga costaii]|uniref:Polysaccharide export outer membrane protein n=1 Tax=Chitinophaga costaii TaxID=1335309 RepID=A0A1C3ZAM4_9BACT|nr:polysaccharide biosynthesis/export family protein [Chitinophaga costaii]PUZ30293.1 BexD/CtrA/VexA family polysaccharide export protein [Chitinophaga costaii]SCB79346.1 polysaccharide export outer membrane protein [Chitinophaga costaii]
MHKTFICFFLLVFAIACRTPQNIIYLQHDPVVTTKIDTTFHVNIQPADLIIIHVDSKDSALTVPFNPASAAGGYVVDQAGYIDFPLFRKVAAAHYSCEQLAALLEKRIIDSAYIRDARVTCRLANFKISVIGEVTKPGVFPVSSERVTVLEALTMAGDLSIFGQRNNVMVVREINGVRSANILDLQSANMFNSPYFYLQQNDIVYVAPNKAKAMQSDYRTRTWPMALSGASVVISLLSLLLVI